MAHEIHNADIQCPYCWEKISVAVDDCGEDQQYIEDCQVCCRPINFHIVVNEMQQVEVNVYAEDE